MWCWEEGMGWWMMFGGIWMLVFWGLIVALVVWGIRKLIEHRDSGAATGRHHSLDIAKERYAKGEISKEEFAQIKKELS
jgi:putative membrane protein